MQSLQFPRLDRLHALSMFLALSATAWAAQAADCAPGIASTSTCTVPAGVTQITIAAWGGGGGGGFGGGGFGGGAGGGGGGYCGQAFTVTPGETLNIEVGVGGAGGYSDATMVNYANGQNGTSSKVESSTNSIGVIASGGGGGTDYDLSPAGGQCSGASGYAGGKGGKATGYVTEVGYPGGGGGGSGKEGAAGGDGGATMDANANGGVGGSGQGAGGDGGGVANLVSEPGKPGSAPGGGGGGGSAGGGGQGYGSGGAGADGRVSLTFTVPDVVVNPTVTAIPTLSEWGLIVLASLLGLVGLRRSRSGS